MMLPFDQNDVRLISIDGNTVRFDLTKGYVEVTFDSREVLQRLMSRQPAASASRHVIYQDGIFGI